MEEFAEKRLPRGCSAPMSVGPSGGRCISIDEPVLLARFISFVKSRAPEASEVYIRGQNQDHDGMVPALFRNCSTEDAPVRYDAYSEVLDMVDQKLGYGRFRRDNVGALLQHYGIHTPWLDVVDNVYTAVWFASHTYDPDAGAFYESTNSHGWLHLVITDFGDCSLTGIDLRKRHSSMNVRPQAQHGFSASSQVDRAPLKSIDYIDAVVARVRFPIGSRFRLSGKLSQLAFLFPPIRLDETYDILLRSNLNDEIARIERRRGLPPKCLGRITRIRYRNRRKVGALIRTNVG